MSPNLDNYPIVVMISILPFPLKSCPTHKLQQTFYPSMLARELLPKPKKGMLTAPACNHRPLGKHPSSL